MDNKDTIRDIVKKELCTICGTCIAICPKGAIKLTIDEKIGNYIPKIKDEKCDNCGICLKVCPGVDLFYFFFICHINLFG